MNIELRNVSQQFGARRALDSLSVRLPAEGLLIVGGPNGAGKSVLLKLLAGILEPTDGEILWDGTPRSERKMAYKFRLGYMPQNPTFYEEQTVAKCLNYFAQLKAIPSHLCSDRITEVIGMTRLASVANRKVKHLSGGERARLAFGVAMLNDPDLLILDEPGTDLDPEERRNLWDHIASMRPGRIIVLATHIFAGLEGLADRLLILDKGVALWDAGVDELLEATVPCLWQVVGQGPVAQPEAQPNWGEGCLVIRQRRQGTMTEWRVLSEARPAPHAELVEPTLEDAYLWVRWRGGSGG